MRCLPRLPLSQETLKETVAGAIQQVGYSLYSFAPGMNKDTNTMTGQYMARFNVPGDGLPTKDKLLMFKPRIHYTMPNGTAVYIRVCSELCTKLNLCPRCHRLLAAAGNPSECTCSTEPRASGTKRQRDEARASNFANLMSLQRTG